MKCGEMRRNILTNFRRESSVKQHVWVCIDTAQRNVWKNMSGCALTQAQRNVWKNTSGCALTQEQRKGSIQNYNEMIDQTGEEGQTFQETVEITGLLFTTRIKSKVQ